MIFIRILMNKIPDTWEPSTIWFLAGVELLIEVAACVLIYTILMF